MPEAPSSPDGVGEKVGLCVVCARVSSFLWFGPISCAQGIELTLAAGKSSMMSRSKSGALKIRDFRPRRIRMVRYV